MVLIDIAQPIPPFCSRVIVGFENALVLRLWGGDERRDFITFGGAGAS
jgi:hypothetical protein